MIDNEYKDLTRSHLTHLPSLSTSGEQVLSVPTNSDTSEASGTLNESKLGANESPKQSTSPHRGQP